MAARAAEIQAKRAKKINVTGNVYPHIQPSDGAGNDVPLRDGRGYADGGGGARHAIRNDLRFGRYAAGSGSNLPREGSEISNWDLEGFDYEESEGYALIYPAR